MLDIRYTFNFWGLIEKEGTVYEDDHYLKHMKPRNKIIFNNNKVLSVSSKKKLYSEILNTFIYI